MNTQTVIKSIKTQLAPTMEKWVKGQCRRIQDLNDFKSTEEYKSIKSSVIADIKCTSSDNKFYKLLNLGYTKKEIQISKNYNTKQIIELFKKESNHKMERVDIAVNKKLTNLNITNIKELNISDGYDGFIEGSWIINTIDNNSYKFGFETILAGGYNIQCLHVRVKYYLKTL